MAKYYPSAFHADPGWPRFGSCQELLEEGTTSFARLCVSETARAMVERQLQAEAEHAQRLSAWQEGEAQEIDMEVLDEVSITTSLLEDDRAA